MHDTGIMKNANNREGIEARQKGPMEGVMIADVGQDDIEILKQRCVAVVVQVADEPWRVSGTGRSHHAPVSVRSTVTV